MELTRLITRIAYRIEPNAGGGFIAHSSDPNVPPLEAATREELQAKIQARIAADLGNEFPSLKVALDRPGRKVEFHIEMKQGGGFRLHSADPNALPIDGATHDDLHSHVAEKLIALAGKDAGTDLGLAVQSGTRGAAPVSASSTLAPTEAGSTGTILRVVFTMIAIAALLYFFFVSRR